MSAIKDATLKMALSLGRRIGDHKVIDDPDILATCSRDESHGPPHMPDLLVRAYSEEDVVQTLVLARAAGVPVVPRGAGTGKSGGAIPVMGGLVLDTSFMNRIVDIDAENLIAVVEPGVITGQFQTAVEELELFYPPDPNSLETCTLGGNAAHNAGGPRAFKYGVTSEYVTGTRVVLMGGTVLGTGKQTVKGVAGYDLTHLLVGSEGTLGVFTRLILRLIPNPPCLATLLIRMPDEETAGRAIARIVASGLVPRVMEFMDGVMVDVLRSAGADGVARDTGALILAEVDGPDERRVEEDAVRLAEFCEAAGAVEVLMARHGGERARLWAARRVLSDAVKQKAAYKVSEDIVVPRSRAADLLVGLKVLSEKHGVLIPSYGHAGDGNYHVNVLWDDPDFQVSAVVEEVFQLALGLGGTITGEHGVGLTKRDYLPYELSVESIEMHKAIKRGFDPDGLLNPGKIF